MIVDWYIVTVSALQDLWSAIITFIPNLIGAIIILVIGWFVSIGVGKLIAEILKRVHFNQLFEREGWKEALEKAEWKVDASSFIGEVAKWILMIVFLLAAVEILGFVQFADFLKLVVLWLPNVIVAVAIFIVTVIISHYLVKLIRAWVEGMQVGYGHLIESIVRWSIWVFAILAILIQLGVARELVITLFSGAVYFAVIAGGLAFGLGGKEIAGEILRDLYSRLKEKEQ